MNPRRVASFLTLPAALGLAACSSSTAGSGSAGSTAATSSSSTAAGSSAPVSSAPASSAPASSAPASSAPASSPAGGGASGAADLGDKLLQGVNAVSSAHITLNIGVGNQAITGSGDEKLTQGKLTALDLSETIPGAGALRLILVDGKTYAKLPSSLNKSAKPYTLVTSTSSDPTIRQLARNIKSTQNSASLGSVATFVSAADSVKTVGTPTVAGVKTTQYAIVVNVSKLPSTYPGKSALTQTGISTIPVDLYLDAQNRPVQVIEKLTVSGQAVSTTVTVGKYNQPVTITAPPASQVSTK